MTSIFKKQLFRFIKILLPLSIILAAIHYFVIWSLADVFTFFLSTWAIYLFHLCITLLIFLGLLAVSKVAFDKVGFAFVAGSLLKMFASVVFLIPLIKAPIASKIPDAFAFFIPYFIYLGLETYFTMRLLQTGESAKDMN